MVAEAASGSPRESQFSVSLDEGMLKDKQMYAEVCNCTTSWKFNKVQLSLFIRKFLTNVEHSHLSQKEELQLTRELIGFTPNPKFQFVNETNLNVSNM